MSTLATINIEIIAAIAGFIFIVAVSVALFIAAIVGAAWSEPKPVRVTRDVPPWMAELRKGRRGRVA